MIRALRPAARGRHRRRSASAAIILPLAILGIREYKSPTKGKDFREGSLGRLVVWLGCAARARPRPARRSPASSIFVGGIVVEDKLDAPDRPDPVGQPGLAGRSRTSHVVERGDRLVERARHLRAGRRRLHRRDRRRSSTTFTPRAARRSTPRTLLTGVEHRRPPSATSSTSRAPSRRRRRPASEVRGRLRRRARRTSSVSTVSPTTAARSTSSSAPARARSRSGPWSSTRSATTIDPPDGHRAPRRRAWPSSASACSRTSRRTGSC